jgi:hypothetical protein
MRDEPDNHRRFKQTRLCGLISTKPTFVAARRRPSYANGVSSTMSRSMHHADIPAT